MKSIFKILEFAMLGAGVLNSCAGDAPENPEPRRKVAATISVVLPQTEEKKALTRADGTITDTDILTVDGLVFDENGKFIERIPANHISYSDKGIKIVLLFEQIDKKRTVHLVANARDKATGADRMDFSPLTEGSPESVVGTLKTASLPASLTNTQNNIMPLIMWGRVELNSGIMDNIEMNGVKLLRAAACVTVKTAEASESNHLGDFVLEGISACNLATVGFLTPTPTVTAAPSATPAAGRPAGTTLADASKTWAEGPVPTLYVYERNCNTTDYMGVIIKGKYKGESGYYKVVMLDSKGTPYNIVRNHRYIITISDVTERGYSDISTAVSSLPSNALKATLVDVNPDYSSITGDSQYIMRMDCNTSEVYGTHPGNTQLNNIVIASVYSDRDITPSVIIPDDASWISGIRAAAEGGNKYSIIASMISDGEDHETDITVRSDNLELPLKLKWHVNDTFRRGAGSYTVNLINAGEKYWNIKVKGGQTASPWFGMINSGENPINVIGTTGFVTEINSRYDPGAYLHINYGENNTARLHKTCEAPDGSPVSANLTVVRHR